MKRAEIRKKGYEALVKELGVVGTIRFIQEFGTGSSNYTQQRHQWLDKLSFDEVVQSLKKSQ